MTHNQQKSKGYVLIFVLWVTISSAAILSFYLSKPPLTKTLLRLTENSASLTELSFAMDYVADALADRKKVVDKRWIGFKNITYANSDLGRTQEQIQDELALVIEALQQSGFDVVVQNQADTQDVSPLSTIRDSNDDVSEINVPKSFVFGGDPRTLTFGQDTYTVTTTPLAVLPNPLFMDRKQMGTYLKNLGLKPRQIRKIVSLFLDLQKKVQAAPDLEWWSWSLLASPGDVTAAELRYLQTIFEVGTQGAKISSIHATPKTVAALVDISAETAEKGLAFLNDDKGDPFNKSLKTIVGIHAAAHFEKAVTNTIHKESPWRITINTPNGANIEGIYSPANQRLLRVYQQ